MVQATAENISEVIRKSTLQLNSGQRMIRSKYGMLEILRAAYNRVEAILLLRQLNHKFLKMSEDAYLETFHDEQDTMYFEVRKPEDLVYFNKMARYSNLLKLNNSMHIEFFWNFKREISEAEEHKESELLVDQLLTARSFKKLTLGADGLWSCYLPETFLRVFLTELGSRRTKIGELCLDLRFFADQHSRTSASQRRLRTGNKEEAYADSSEIINSLADILVDNPYLLGLTIYNSSLSSLSGFFNGLKIQQANLREQIVSGTELIQAGLHQLTLQEVTLADDSLMAELTQTDQSLLSQLTTIKVFQCRAPQTSWRKIARHNCTLQTLLVENCPSMDERENRVNVPNFSSLILKNAPLSKLESFDFTCAEDLVNKTAPVVTEEMWLSLAQLKELGKLKKFYIRAFDKWSAGSLLSNSDPSVQWMKEYLKVGRSSQVSFKWPHETFQW